MAKLYEINAAIMQVLELGFDQECVDPETGEILFERAEARLLELEVEEAAKLEGIVCFLKNLDSDVKQFKAEEKTLAERRKVKEKKAEWLKSFISGYMEATDKKKFETARCALSFRKSEALEITDADSVKAFGDGKYTVIVPAAVAIDNAALKRDIKAGEEIPGALVVTRQNLQVK